MIKLEALRQAAITETENRWRSNDTGIPEAFVIGELSSGARFTINLPDDVKGRVARLNSVRRAFTDLGEVAAFAVVVPGVKIDVDVLNYEELDAVVLPDGVKLEGPGFVPTVWVKASDGETSLYATIDYDEDEVSYMAPANTEDLTDPLPGEAVYDLLDNETVYA
jgi:hypothetical protein